MQEQEIKCPHCGKSFIVNESEYAQLLSQVRNAEFNTEVEFEAIAAHGYEFAKWEDGNTDNPRSIVTTSDISLTAKFIGVTPKEGGIVETKKEGNSFVFTAVPSNGYYFSQWNKKLKRALIVVKKSWLRQRNANTVVNG